MFSSPTPPCHGADFPLLGSFIFLMEDNNNNNNTEAPSVCRAQQILVDLKQRRESFNRALASHSSLGNMMTDSPKAPRRSLKPPPSPSTLTSTLKTNRANEILLDMKQKKMAISSVIRKSLPLPPPMSPCKSNSHSSRLSDFSSPTALTASTTMSSTSPETDYGTPNLCLFDTMLHQGGDDKESNSGSPVELASEAPSMATRKPAEKDTTGRQGYLSTELATILKSSMIWGIPSQQMLHVSSGRSLDKESLSLPSVPATLLENGSMHDLTDGNLQKKETLLRLANGESVAKNITEDSSLDLRELQEKQDLVVRMIRSLTELRKQRAAIERMVQSSSSIESHTSQLIPVLSRYLEKAQSSHEFQTRQNSQYTGSSPSLSSYLERGYPTFEELKSKSRRSLGAASAITLDVATSVRVASNYILPITPKRPRRKILIKPCCNSLPKLTDFFAAATPSPTDLLEKTNEKIVPTLYSDPEMTFSEPCFQPEDDRDRRSHISKKKSSSSRKKGMSSKKRKPRPPGLPRTISVIHSSRDMDDASSDDSIHSVASKISNTSSRACCPSKQAQELIEKWDAIILARDPLSSHQTPTRDVGVQCCGGIYPMTVRSRNEISTIEPLTRDIGGIGGQWCGGLYHLAVRSGMNGTVEQEV